MFDEVHGGPRGVAGVLVLRPDMVRVVKDCKHLVIEVRVNGPVLVVQPSLLRMLSEDYILLCGRRPC